jgi:hypothetical protein
MLRPKMPRPAGQPLPESCLPRSKLLCPFVVPLMREADEVEWIVSDSTRLPL